MPYGDPERQREYQKNWIAKRREEWFRSNGPCVDCGSVTDLQIDHRDRKTKVSHRIWSWSKPRREEELAKCDVRCWPCHKVKSGLEVARGEGLRCSILTEIQVLEIRRRYAEGESQSVLGREFGVTRHGIYRVVHRKSWAHI